MDWNFHIGEALSSPHRSSEIVSKGFEEGVVSILSVELKTIVDRNIIAY